MSSAADERLAPEAKARKKIDRMLEAAGWKVQDAKAMDLQAARGVAVREFVLRPPHGRVDYMLFVDGRPVGVVEAKPEGTTLTGVEWQTEKYLFGLPDGYDAPVWPLPFAYESTGTETRFTCTADPDARSRPVFWFHRPETFAAHAREWEGKSPSPTLRYELRWLPELDPTGLWPAQATAIERLEESLGENRPRALIQMATGAGKTFTAANVCYRLVKHARARRILFLVDRANLGRQTLKEFQAFTTPDDRRKFTELYNVQHLSSDVIDQASRVTISTVQRLYSILTGSPLEPEDDEKSLFELEERPEPGPKPVDYNPKVPIETFDFIIVDECHRSIYGLWRQVLEYFEAFLIGLTATPSLQTFGFFNRNLVMEYPHERAVADGVNVDFDVYRIRTEITEHGGKIPAGIVTGFRDRETRKVRWEETEDELTYAPGELDRTTVAKDQIRTVIRAFREKLFTEIFPGRTHVPKTLIFAKDDSHADDIVQVVREEFGKGNDFCRKITYRTTGNTDDLIAEFRNSYNPRVAVTVDMIATGTDVKPLECLVFMRTVRSRTFFEQMKGRGVRVINEADLRAVTPDARAKTHFVIVDAVGVTETELSDTYPLERKPRVSFAELVEQIAGGVRDLEAVSSLASRLARLDRQISRADREDLKQAAGGLDLTDLVRGLVDAGDPDRHLEAAQEATGKDDPTPDEVAEAARSLVNEAVRPIVDDSAFREKLVAVRRSYEQAIDEVSADVVLESGFSRDATDRAKAVVESWRQFIEEHRDEITALQVLYSTPWKQRLAFSDIKELANAIGRPPLNLAPERIWEAYAALERSKVRGSGGRMLTDIVSLVRYTLEQDDELVPFAERVNARFEAWFADQERAGRPFTDEQRNWLEMIRDHVAGALAIDYEDFDLPPFAQHGGLGKAHRVFGDDLDRVLKELPEVLVA